jgi:hypothetical protein
MLSPRDRTVVGEVFLSADARNHDGTVEILGIRDGGTIVRRILVNEERHS